MLAYMFTSYRLKPGECTLNTLTKPVMDYGIYRSPPVAMFCNLNSCVTFVATFLGVFVAVLMQ